MGSFASKSAPSSSSSAAAAAAADGGGGGRAARRARSKAHRVLQSSCLGTTSRSRHCSDNGGDQGKENGNIAGSESRQEKIECYRKVKVRQSDEIPSNTETVEWGQANITDTTPTIGSSSARANSTQSSNPSNRFLSRFSFVPGNMSFRLNRANSLGSSGSRPINGEDRVVDRDEQIYCEETSGDLRLNARAGFSIDSRDDRESSYTQDGDRNGSVSGPILCSPRNQPETESAGARVSSREPADRNVRFSRTLSVGRLRDRVLRRSSLSDSTFCPVQQVGEARDVDPGSGARSWGHSQTRAVVSEASDDVASSNSSGFPSSNAFSFQDYELETPRSREPRYHNLLEHRSNFLERRRRIRSQVRALQRLGSRFENVSGHERTCILSGQYRTGRCTCRTSNRDPHLNDDSSARASISRIVMLAEALFEVLDEIHQQSVVLSSRPSVSSIGSVPAPSEVVESLPVKLYTKQQKHQHDEVPQCYICLVEYEEGDRMRILPCHHDFHKACVDKWLKEIHRVCPLCRGDICRSDSLTSQS